MFYSILIALALGYLLGTIPFGLFFALASGAGDVRKIGSGNIGATNVLRTGKKWAAAATLLCDGAKGAPADLVLLDENEPLVVDAEKLHSRARNTAFEGRKFQGRAKVTFVGGVCVSDAR